MGFLNAQARGVFEALAPLREALESTIYLFACLIGKNEKDMLMFSFFFLILECIWSAR